MTDTANLQSHQLRLTVKQIANLWNVSERMIYSARELIRTGREDICDEVMACRLKMHAALKLAKPEKYGSGRNYRPGDDHYSALVQAWNRCSDEERSLFTARLLAKMREQEADFKRARPP